MQVHDARAARITYVTDDGPLADRRAPRLDPRRRTLEVSEEDGVIAQPSPFSQRVARDHGIAEELAHEENLRVSLLVLELHQLHRCTARCSEIEPAVPDVGELATTTLVRFRQIEVVAAHGEIALRNGDRITIGVVGGRTIGPSRDLVVRLDAAALVVVGACHGRELVPAEGGTRRNWDARVAVRKGEGWTERRDALRVFTGRRARPHDGAERGQLARGAAAQEDETEGHRGGSIQGVHTDVEYDTSSVMGLSNRSGVESALDELFQTEQRARTLAVDIASGPAEVVLTVLIEAVARARKLDDEKKRVAQLESIAKILGELGGPDAVDALIDILGSEEPEARHAAGIVLEELSFERFKEVALGVERALAKLAPDHLALSELPYILIEVPEPGVVKLIHRFLEHPNEEVAAAAIEACVELGDPSSVSKLSRLESDKRLVELDDGESEQNTDSSVTIGDLAKEARLLLQSLEPEDRA